MLALFANCSLAFCCCCCCCSKVASADLKLLPKTNQRFVGLKLCGIILVDLKSLWLCNCCCRCRCCCCCCCTCCKYFVDFRATQRGRERLATFCCTSTIRKGAQEIPHFEKWEMQQFYFILNTVSCHCRPHLVFNGNSIAEITVAKRQGRRGGRGGECVN